MTNLHEKFNEENFTIDKRLLLRIYRYISYLLLNWQYTGSSDYHLNESKKKKFVTLNESEMFCWKW